MSDGYLIEELRLYKMNGEYLCFELGEQTSRGQITKIIEMLSPGWFRIEYDGGKRYANLSGFNGFAILKGPEVI